MLTITKLKESSCRFLVRGHTHYCGEQKRPGSSYCPAHHALCYIPAPKGKPGAMKGALCRPRRLEVA